jgi:hypothetical protein
MELIMTAGKPNSCTDDLEGWSVIAINLCKLKMATEYAQDFSRKFTKFMDAEDRDEILALNIKYDGLYWKYWEKLIKKIRGI